MSSLPAALLVAAAVLVLLGVPAPRRGAVAGGRSPHGGLVVIGVVLLLAGAVAALTTGLGVVAGRRWWSRRRLAQERKAEQDGAAEALAVFASELRAGRPTAVALHGAAEVSTGPLARGLRAAAASGEVGADPVACLLAETGRSAVPELLRGLAACWQVCAGTGSSLAHAVDRLADGLAAEHAQQLVVEAELAGPRATAALLSLLPVAGMALAAGLGADPLQVLLHTPAGLACLALGLALDAAGLWWTRALVAAARRPR